MHLSQKLQRFMLLISAPVLFLAIAFAIYYGSIPEKYQLRPGDASPFDITSPRSIRDPVETRLRAEKAAAEVPDVMLRSEQIVAEVMSDKDVLLSIISSHRAKYQTELEAYEAAVTAANQNPEDDITDQDLPDVPEAQVQSELLIKEINDSLNVVILAEDALALVRMENSRFESLSGHVSSLMSLIMSQPVDTSALRLELNQRIQTLSESMNFYREDAGLVERILGLVLKPNVVYDAVSTANARQAAYERVLNNPVMIERGTRIVLMDDIITDETYALLEELDLIDSGMFDIRHFLGIILLLLILTSVAVFYLRKFEPEIIKQTGNRISLLLAVIIPLIVSIYTVRDFPLTAPVYFAAVLISAYFGFRTSMLMTALLTMAVMPMTGFDPLFPIIAISGGIVAALTTKGITRRDNYALIIIMTAGTNLAVTLAFGLLQKEGWSSLSIQAGYTAISGTLSVIAAIGIMPLFEMMFNTVSPLRLIELSQPGHPLLRRLFVEAPGSSQHSMMVANLADAAANAIGANTLLARVGAYYHDIGKLENPIMFTENQQGENPHDYLPPEQSADIILSHPEQGVRIGKRYRLPAPILKIIHEHHGSSSQAYFYHKAKQLAEENGLETPDIDRYKYHCPIPSSRESAIVMISDSIEAAVKSTGITKLDELEALIRKIIKGKNEQDQLIHSGLSYKDVEDMIKSFLQVYAGHFHERVKYPDERKVPQPAK
ncbi:MAG: HDIG domain-containing protein [Eubacteriales bacterium]|nr:HDIG domain-containing protein [Eubacteriales bacterium]